MDPLNDAVLLVFFSFLHTRNTIPKQTSSSSSAAEIIAIRCYFFSTAVCTHKSPTEPFDLIGSFATAHNSFHRIDMRGLENKWIFTLHYDILLFGDCLTMTHCNSIFSWTTIRNYRITLTIHNSDISESHNREENRSKRCTIETLARSFAITENLCRVFFPSSHCSFIFIELTLDFLFRFRFDGSWYKNKAYNSRNITRKKNTPISVKFKPAKREKVQNQ